jgi:cyclopropane-fatty-acyl-phospholipid synthase
VAFDIVLPDGTRRSFGSGAATFTAWIKNGRGLRAMSRFDEGTIGDAFVYGDVEIEGDMLQPFALRQMMSDTHFLLYAWRFIQPLFFGQVYTNKSAIASHYDIDPHFFLSFLDADVPCYTQGIFENEHETLKIAALRKFDYCFEKLLLKPGDHILEIGPGWGAWFEYASRRGVRCTGITNSDVSKKYLDARAAALKFDWRIVQQDFLHYSEAAKYDAIIIMGVIEHLPAYERVLDNFVRLLKPGGRVFLDASAGTKKYQLSSFMVKHIYPGNHSFLALDDFVSKLFRGPLRIEELHNDRMSYFYTFREWARNLDRNRPGVIERYGDMKYRSFRMYLWGAAYEFLSGSLDCYRMILR